MVHMHHMFSLQLFVLQYGVIHGNHVFQAHRKMEIKVRTLLLGKEPALALSCNISSWQKTGPKACPSDQQDGTWRNFRRDRCIVKISSGSSAYFSTLKKPKPIGFSQPEEELEKTVRLEAWTLTSSQGEHWDQCETHWERGVSQQLVPYLTYRRYGPNMIEVTVPKPSIHYIIDIYIYIYIAIM